MDYEIRPAVRGDFDLKRGVFHQNCGGDVTASLFNRQCQKCGQVWRAAVIERWSNDELGLRFYVKQQKPVGAPLALVWRTEGKIRFLSAVPSWSVAPDEERFKL